MCSEQLHEYLWYNTLLWAVFLVAISTLELHNATIAGERDGGGVDWVETNTPLSTGRLLKSIFQNWRHPALEQTMHVAYHVMRQQLLQDFNCTTAQNHMISHKFSPRIINHFHSITYDQARRQLPGYGTATGRGSGGHGQGRIKVLKKSCAIHSTPSHI